MEVRMGLRRALCGGTFVRRNKSTQKCAVFSTPPKAAKIFLENLSRSRRLHIRWAVNATSPLVQSPTVQTESNYRLQSGSQKFPNPAIGLWLLCRELRLLFSLGFAQYLYVQSLWQRLIKEKSPINHCSIAKISRLHQSSRLWGRESSQAQPLNFRRANVEIS